MNTTGTPTEPCSALANAASLRSPAESDNDRGSSPTMPEDYQSPPPTPSPGSAPCSPGHGGSCSGTTPALGSRPGRPTRNCGYSGRTAPTWLPLTAELITLRTAGSARPTIRPAPPRPGRPPVDAPRRPVQVRPATLPCLPAKPQSHPVGVPVISRTPGNALRCCLPRGDWAGRLFSCARRTEGRWWNVRANRGGLAAA